MIESLLYVNTGFAVTYLSLEVAWHFSACKIQGNDKIKHCIFKEIKTVLIEPQTCGGVMH